MRALGSAKRRSGFDLRSRHDTKFHLKLLYLSLLKAENTNILAIYLIITSNTNLAFPLEL